MDTITAIILSCFISTTSPKKYYVFTDNKIFKLEDSLTRPEIYNYFIYGIPGNKFYMITKNKSIVYIEAK